MTMFERFAEVIDRVSFGESEDDGLIVARDERFSLYYVPFESVTKEALHRFARMTDTARSERNRRG